MCTYSYVVIWKIGAHAWRTRNSSVQVTAWSPEVWRKTPTLSNILEFGDEPTLLDSGALRYCPVSPYSDNDTLESASIGECITKSASRAQRLHEEHRGWHEGPRGWHEEPRVWHAMCPQILRCNAQIN